MSAGRETVPDNGPRWLLAPHLLCRGHTAGLLPRSTFMLSRHCTIKPDATREAPVAYVDFDDLKKRFNIEQVAHLLGLVLKPSNGQLRGECPACKQGGARALTITPTHVCKNGAVGGFYCQVERQGGDLIQLIAHIRGTDVHKAASWLDGNSVNSKKSRDSGTVPRTESERGFKALDYLEPEHEAVTIGVGFSPEIATDLGIGYAPKGILKGTVAIPIRDESGILMGYIGITEATLPASFKPTENKVVPLKRA